MKYSTIRYIFLFFFLGVGILFLPLESGVYDSGSWDNPEFPFNRVSVIVLLFALLGNAFLLFRYFYYVLQDPCWAMLVAFIWVLSPAHVATLGNSENWPFAYGCLAMLIALLYYERMQSRLQPQQAYKYFIGIIVLAHVVSLYMSPVFVAVPLLIVLRDYTMEPHRFQLVRSKLVYSIMGALSLVAFALFFVQGAGAYHPLITRAPDWQIHFSAAYLILEPMLQWVWCWDRQSVLPTLEPGEMALRNPLFWLTMILLVRQCWRMRKKYPSLLFGIGWFLLAMLPVSSLFTHHTAPKNDAYLFVSSIGLAFLLVKGLMQFPMVIGRRSGVGREMILWSFVGISISVVIIQFAVETHRRISIWNSPVKLIDKTLAEHPGNYAAKVEKIRWLARNGQLHAAQEAYFLIEDHHPDYPETPYLKMELLFRLKEFDPLQREIDAFLQEVPDDARVLSWKRSQDSEVRSQGGSKE